MKMRNIITLLTSTILLIVAFLHNKQIDSDIYTKSIYIPIEMLLAAVTIILILIGAFSVVLDLIKKNWKNLWITVVVLFISIILFIIAMQIDAPTLIYMT